MRSLLTIPFNIGDEFEVVTLSINPRETPALAHAKKASYLNVMVGQMPSAGWHFLTGELASIEKVARRSGSATFTTRSRINTPTRPES